MGKKQQSEDLPDLNDKEVADASLKIQTVFRGFQARKKVAAKKEMIEGLPDLNDKDVQNAAVKIQSAFKGHRTRMTVNQAVFKAKKDQATEEDLPDLKDKDVADATKKIQSAFRGFQTRKEMKKQKEVGFLFHFLSTSKVCSLKLQALLVQVYYAVDHAYLSRGFLLRQLC